MPAPQKYPEHPPGVSYDGAAGLASSDAVDINGLRVCPHNSWDRHPSLDGPAAIWVTIWKMCDPFDGWGITFPVTLFSLSQAHWHWVMEDFGLGRPGQ